MKFQHRPSSEMGEQTPTEKRDSRGGDKKGRRSEEQNDN